MPCRKLDEYRILAKIGQGTFGEVYKAVDKTTHQHVALKKVCINDESEFFPITTLREIKALQILKHQNVVTLLHVCVSEKTNGPRDSFYIVMEFCEHDLAGILSNRQIRFELVQKKTIMKQLLDALYFIHGHHFLHRDLKPSNILITSKGILKLADFGLCKKLQSERPQCLTNKVVTLWYRPPDILLGSRCYGPEIDMWGAGCIMAELWTRSAIMPGQNEQHQLVLISQMCGSITPESLPGIEQLELYNKTELPKGRPRQVRERLRNYVRYEYGVDLLDKMLEIDPKKRIKSDSALAHNFFSNTPLPGDLSGLMSKIRVSMFELLANKRKAEAQMRAQLPPNAKRAIIDDPYQETIY